MVYFFLLVYLCGLLNITHPKLVCRDDEKPQKKTWCEQVVIEETCPFKVVFLIRWVVKAHKAVEEGMAKKICGKGDKIRETQDSAKITH